MTQVRPSLAPNMATHPLEISVNNIATVQIFQSGSRADELNKNVRPGYCMPRCYLQDVSDCDVGGL
jgi:hypothetical protein